MKKQDFVDIYAIAERKYGAEAAQSIFKIKKKDTWEAGFEQPLPDVIGFHQHSAECVSDSIQEVLLFADGIREYTQPILYGLTKEQIDLRVRLALDYEDWHRVQEYLYFIQKRFRAHYDAINYLRVHKIAPQKYYDEQDAMCEMNPIFKYKKRASLEAGVLALKHYKDEAVYTSTGLVHKEAKKLIDGILTVFSIPFRQEASINLDGVGIILIASYKTVMSDGILKTRSLGHAVGFLKVFGDWFYYDDNLGFIKVAKEIMNELKKGRLGIVIYKKVYFARMNSSGTTAEFVWTDGQGWGKDGVDIFKSVGCYMYVPLPDAHMTILESGPEERKTKESVNKFHKLCKIKATDLKPKNVKGLVATMEKFRNCIYSNVSSNSAIFENMYKFLYETIALVKSEPDTLEFLQNSIKTVVTRPACSPMSIYWCSLIMRALMDKDVDSFSWFNVPKLKTIHVEEKPANTPPELLKKLEEAAEKRKKEESPHLTPCLPGQIRNMKTLKCRDRKKRSLKSKKAVENDENGTKNKKSRCPTGQVRDPTTGLCVDRAEPCPPGQVRNRVTKKCRDRAGEPCPEGQVRDPVTKLCRDQKKYKF